MNKPNTALRSSTGKGGGEKRRKGMKRSVLVYIVNKTAHAAALSGQQTAFWHKTGTAIKSLKCHKQESGLDLGKVLKNKQRQL